MARPERVAEKVSTFLNRGLDRDAYDLYFQAHANGPKSLAKGEWAQLGELVADKVELDADFEIGEDLLARFDNQW